MVTKHMVQLVPVLVERTVALLRHSQVRDDILIG